MERESAVPDPRRSRGPTDSGVIDRARASVLAGRELDPVTMRQVRPVVVESWRRSRAAGFRPGGRPPAPALRRPPPGPAVLAVLSAVRAELLEQVRRRGLVVGVTDANGVVLWVDGAPEAVARAAQLTFRPGVHWTEDHVGTTAAGLALRLGTPAAVWGPEHLHGPARTWSAVAAPVEVGSATVGSVTVLGQDADAVAAAGPALRSVGDGIARRVSTGGRLPHRRPRLDLVVLGLGQPVAHDAVGTWRLPLRGAELLVLLAEAGPAGLTTEQIARALSDPPLEWATVRSEVHRLRTLVGRDALLARPYRLDLDTSSDLARLREGRTTHRGAFGIDEELLPRSTAPAIVALRRDARRRRLALAQHARAGA